MLENLINEDVDVNDIEVEDGKMVVYVASSDLHKAQEAIEKMLPNVEFDVCAIKMLPHEYVKIENPEDRELWDRLLTLLDDCDDVQEVFHNVED